MNVKPIPLSPEAFRPYGSYAVYGAMDDKKEAMTYLADIAAVRLGCPIAGIGVLFADPQEAVMTEMEIHSHTEEGWVVLNGPCVAAFGTPCDDPNDATYQAFEIPAGTVLSLSIGVWHFAPIACGKARTTVLCLLPPNTPENDIVVRQLHEPMTIS